MVKSQEAKSRARNQLYFHTLAMKSWKLKINTTYNNIQKLEILRDTFNNHVPDLYNEIFKAYLNEIEKDLNKLRDKPCSCIRKLNIIKIAILPKLIQV